MRISNLNTNMINHLIQEEEELIILAERAVQEAEKQIKDPSRKAALNALTTLLANGVIHQDEKEERREEIRGTNPRIGFRSIKVELVEKWRNIDNREHPIDNREYPIMRLTEQGFMKV